MTDNKKAFKDNEKDNNKPKTLQKNLKLQKLFSM